MIQAIRGWIEHDPAAQTGWLRALRDKQIGRALTLIHRDPARAWTLTALASEVAMSRSALAARFAELVGEPPMHYVARWRMHLAMTWLRERETGLGELAGRLGYQSEAAFSRAFKRVVGVARRGTEEAGGCELRPCDTRIKCAGGPRPSVMMHADDSPRAATTRRPAICHAAGRSSSGRRSA